MSGIELGSCRRGPLFTALTGVVMHPLMPTIWFRPQLGPPVQPVWYNVLTVDRPFARTVNLWHDKFTCEELKAIPVSERAPEDLVFAELAKKQKWKRCPKCGTMVERTEGCNHMTCRCAYEFCYVCGVYYYRCQGHHY